MSKTGKPNSRWNRGNERYTKPILDWIYDAIHEQPGWWKGARVRKKK